MTPTKPQSAVTELVHKKTQLRILHDADIFDVQGYRAGAVHAGLKKRRRAVTVIVSDCPATCAGVFTQNAVVAAPIIVSRETVKAGSARVIVCNSGCAT